MVHEIRERVRARYPEGEAAGIDGPLPDLMPLLHARDAAEAKVAAIGSVNPREAGPVNAAIQFVKRTIARSLGWFVRDQVDFNRAILTALEANLEALNEVNRTFVAIGGRLTKEGLQGEVQQLKDIRKHWVHWRDEWEKKRSQTEIHYLRGLAELQASFDLRMAKMDTEYRESALAQHAQFKSTVEHSMQELHQRFWGDLTKIRLEYEQLIHNELRVIRQKAFASARPQTPAAPHAVSTPLAIDYARFADRFRGSEEYVLERQRFYAPYFAGRSNVLDIGCGRGEFLELMREAGVSARGVDLDEESVAMCRTKGLQADAADVFEMLALEPDASFGGIFASQVVEHMTPEQVPQLVKLCASKLQPGGIFALETPNPECLAIFATHFYLDPTHQRPVPSGLLVFYYEEFGFGQIEVHHLSPAEESMPSLKELPEAFRNSFFGGLDYGIIGRRL